MTPFTNPIDALEEAEFLANASGAPYRVEFYDGFMFVHPKDDLVYGIVIEIINPIEEEI